MIFSMDLNASPLPEEDDEEIFEDHEDHVEGGLAVEEHIETSVETFRREREERRQRMKMEYQDEGPNRTLQHPRKDPVVQTKRPRYNDRFKPPSGWLDCPSYGKCIDDIIPSKVPLGESFNDSVAPGKRYSLRQVINKQKVAGRELGLVIDLTNTTRYYAAAEFKSQGIKHVKIACKGRDSVPDNESVNNFVYEVLQFKSRQKQSKKYIFVHCTHGHNRTGYMIIHFLMRSQLQPISVTEAIERFANARPPGIYKQDYIDALYTFYHERKPETVICPPTPEWKRSSDFDLNGEAVPDEDDDGASYLNPTLQYQDARLGYDVEILDALRRVINRMEPDTIRAAAAVDEVDEDDHVESEVMTNDDVLGDAIPTDQQDAMRQFCYQTLKLGTGAKRMSQFPGSHPVSLNRENLQLLRQRYYYATWKADGTRYMMLLTRDGCYLVDRNFCFRRVQMRFLTRSTNEGLAEKHSLTLLDGEMIIDTVPDTQKQERRYLIYDLMAINGKSIVELPFYERWKMLEKEVIEPRNVERQHIIHGRINHYYRYDLEPFRVRRKDFWLLSTVHKVLNEFIPRLSHAADGLIFQGWDDPYVPRTHEGLLKWKYPEMNSVDFLFEMGDQDRPLLYINERGNRKLMEGNRVVFKGDSDASAFSGKIIECSWDSEEGVWVCMRIRADKSTPNEFNTYKKVMRSIRDNITEDVLLNEIGEIVRLPMYADRIRIDSKAAQMHHQHPNSARRR